jgi:hypothetical protein
VVAAAAPVEAAVQPVLAAATDTVGTLTHDVVAAAAPVEAAVQPVLAAATDTVGTLTHDVVAAAAPVEAAVQPVLAAATDTVGTLTHDVVAVAAPVEAAVQPALTTVSDAAGTLSHDATIEPMTVIGTAPSDPASDLSRPANSGAGDTLANAAPVVQTTESPAITAVAPSDTASDVSHPADTLLALANATDAPIQLPVSPTTAPAQTGADLHLTVAGDAIALQDAPPPANALFNGNQYTQYGVALSSDGAGSAHDAVSSADAASAQHTSVSAVADVQHAPPPPDIADPAHTTDHHAIL